MPLPSVTGPDSNLFTEHPIEVGDLIVTFRIRFISGPVMDTIETEGRDRHLAELVKERDRLIQDTADRTGRPWSEVAAETPIPSDAPLRVDDIAVPMLTAGIRSFYTSEDSSEQTWTGQDAQEFWFGPDGHPEAAWPQFAKTELFAAVRTFSTRGPNSDPFRQPRRNSPDG